MSREFGPPSVLFCECERKLDAPCARCGGPACPVHDLCYGCGRIVCGPCNRTPTPEFAFPGDSIPHPHSEVDDE